jgi:neutral ceramidase
VPLLAGAATVDITPPLPVDVLGYVRRAVAPRTVWEPLEANACVLRTDDTTLVIVAADVVGLTTAMADRIRARIAEVVDVDPANILLNSSHSHASPWPGATVKMGGEADGWTERELRYWESIPDLYASAAVQAADALQPARIAGGVGRVHGLAVNRRERTDDGRTILGWNREGFIDESVVSIRVDAARGDPADPEPIATIVGFGCHPVIVGPEVPHIGPDFVGPLRTHLGGVLRPGSVTVFLQGAAGDVLPLEAFMESHGTEVAFGERLALEAAHAVADLDPRPMTIDRTAYGSVTPISLYRRRLADDPPEQPLRAVRRLVDLPLLELPTAGSLEEELVERRTDLERREAAGESRATTNPVKYHIRWIELMLEQERGGGRPTTSRGEIWAARVADCAIVGAPGEIFGAIGAAVRAASPAPVTLFAGYCQGVLGYIATPEEYPFGGYEPTVSHRGYGHPAPFAPEVAGIIRDTALELLRELFPEPAG